MFSCELSKIFKNIFSYRTPLVASSDMWYNLFGFGYYKFCLKTGNNNKNGVKTKFSNILLFLLK